MKTKERSDEPVDYGYPYNRLFDGGTPMGWDPMNLKDFPLSYWDDYPKGTVRPPLAEYFAKALGCGLQNSLQPLTWAGVSRIEYDVSSNRSKFNYCYHTANKARLLPLSYKLEQINNPTYINVMPLYRFGIGGSPRTIINFEGDVDRRRRSSRAWWTMQPRFEGYFNACNFLIELSDFKFYLGKFIKLLNANWYKIAKYKQTLAKMSSGEGTAISANAWLSLKLAIEPLLADLANIASSLMASVEAAQNRFDEAGKSGTTSHYTEEVSKIDQLVGRTGNWTGVLADGTLFESKFTATMCMKYDYNMRSPMEALLKFWGLDGSFSTIWEISRLSFVVDYFIKIGKAIHAMEKDDNVSNVVATKYCESYKGSESSGLHVHGSRTKRLKECLISGAPVMGTQIVSGYQATYYLRELGSLYKGLYIPLTKTPNTTQGATLLALTRSMLG